jgi:hypothetical protein
MRFEIRSREVMPHLEEFYQFLSKSFDANPKFRTVLDIFVNASLGRSVNDLINRLETSLLADASVRDDWRRISSYYGRLSACFYVICVASLSGIPLVAFGSYYADTFWNGFIVGVWLVGTSIGITCVLLLVQSVRGRTFKSRYRKARETYVVDSPRG